MISATKMSAKTEGRFSGGRWRCTKLHATVIIESPLEKDQRSTILVDGEMGKKEEETKWKEVKGQ